MIGGKEYILNIFCYSHVDECRQLPREVLLQGCRKSFTA
jgi:hypothetical protein